MFNAVLASKDYIKPLWSKISVLLPLDFELKCILVEKFYVFSTQMADFEKLVTVRLWDDMKPMYDFSYRLINVPYIIFCSLEGVPVNSHF